MVCEELDQLEWDFIQASAGSLDIDSLGWTERPERLARDHAAQNITFRSRA